MESIEFVIRRFVESSSRRGIVLFVTLGLVLAVIWPLADDYVELRNRRANAAIDLDYGKSMFRDLAALEKRVVEEEVVAAESESHLIAESNVHAFGNALIEMALDSGCKVRQVEPGTIALQDFDKSARIKTAFADVGVGPLPFKSPYKLATQPIDLKLVGSLGNLESFLTRLRTANPLIHTNRATFRSDRSDSTQVELEMNIELFDLRTATPAGN